MIFLTLWQCLLYFHCFKHHINLKNNLYFIKKYYFYGCYFAQCVWSLYLISTTHTRPSLIDNNRFFDGCVSPNHTQLIIYPDKSVCLCVLRHISHSHCHFFPSILCLHTLYKQNSCDCIISCAGSFSAIAGITREIKIAGNKADVGEQ